MHRIYRCEGLQEIQQHLRQGLWHHLSVKSFCLYFTDQDTQCSGTCGRNGSSRETIDKAMTAEQGVVADGSVCHGLCRAQPAPSRPAAKRYVRRIQKREPSNMKYIHGYDLRENIRLQDQASTLVQLLHSDTIYPPGSIVLRSGCGVGAQTITLAKDSPYASFTSVDI